MTNKLMVCLLIVLSLTAAGCDRPPEAKITVKVLDELSNPINKVKVKIGFLDSKFMEHGIKDVSKSGVTGTDGCFNASGRTMFITSYRAEKQGYYKSYGEYHFATSANGRWQPWNPEIKLLLRKIEHPVPMYARYTQHLALPAANKPIGLDLIEYDWVSPYGKGKHADFIFKMTGTELHENKYNYSLDITFPNKFDGIQLIKEDRKYGSMLKLPGLAPDSGYVSHLRRSKSRVPGGPPRDDTDDDNNYIFRIRSEEKNGKLIRAMYGKIQGDIVFDLMKSKKTPILFKYYLNPDYSKNLEFDIERNLFKDLDSMEKVGLD